MNTVVVNGKKYELPNGNVNVINGVVYCNGKQISDADTVKEVKIVINGDVSNFSCDTGDVKVNGNVGTLESDTGNVTVNGNVEGDVTVDTGSIKCGNIGGNATTDCGSINKSVDISKAVGNVINKVKRKIDF